MAARQQPGGRIGLPAIILGLGQRLAPRGDEQRAVLDTRVLRAIGGVILLLVVEPALFVPGGVVRPFRSEEHTSELQSLMRISYAVFCLKKKRHNKTHINQASSHKRDKYHNSNKKQQKKHRSKRI